MESKELLSYYMLESEKIEPKNFERKIKIALISSFTINGLAETIKVKCSENKIGCITFEGGYNQYNQEILDKNSTLYQFSPEITFLILDVRSIFGELFHFPYSFSEPERKAFVNEKITEIISLIKKFRETSTSKLVISNLGIPHYSPHGIAETKTRYSFHDTVLDFNQKLKENTLDFESVYIFDFFRFMTKYGETNVFNFQNFLFGDIKIALNYIPKLAHELMPFIISTLGLTKKCIVLDLDNTLWGGIAGEDGFDGIRLGPQPPGNAYVEFQKTLKALTHRGIILAINSKNNLDDAMKIIEDHPHMILKKDDFACIKINWNDKVSNMKQIAKELNLGLDSLVFFDDDPVNRELVRETIPEVTTPELSHDPSKYVEILQSLNEFSVFQVTNEDLNRKVMYSQQRKRQESEAGSTNLDEFLKTLDLHISIKKSNSFTIPRISQLILKTNQFNLSTKRYQEDDIRKFSDDDNMLIGCAQVKDKFGDNGITGVFIVKKQNQSEWFLDTFLLSCRVMGREVEKAILNHIINEAKKSGIKKIKSQYIPTKKNKPIENFLPDCGFVQEKDYWVFDLTKTFHVPEFLTTNVE